MFAQELATERATVQNLTEVVAANDEDSTVSAAVNESRFSVVTITVNQNLLFKCNKNTQ